MAKKPGEQMLDVTKFYMARVPSKQPGFDQLTLRVPSLRGVFSHSLERESYFTGEDARRQVAQLYLASTVGILKAAGNTDLANRVHEFSMGFFDERDTDPAPSK